MGPCSERVIEDAGDVVRSPSAGTCVGGISTAVDSDGDGQGDACDADDDDDDDDGVAWALWPEPALAPSPLSPSALPAAEAVPGGVPLGRRPPIQGSGRRLLRAATR